jgi:hypothetical protein
VRVNAGLVATYDSLKRVLLEDLRRFVDAEERASKK